MGESAGGQVQGPGQGTRRVGPWGQHFDLFTFGHPLLPYLRQQIEVQLVGKEQRDSCAQLFVGPANAR